jgi:uncharacterized protein YqgV (UPF0045/DUF77 family)
MNTISVQVSLCLLRQAHVSPSHTKVLQVFRARGLDVRPSSMSTVVIGESGNEMLKARNNHE